MKERLADRDISHPARYLFVGEEPSKKALAMGVTWEDGKLAARQLFDALLACGIRPEEQKFINLFDEGEVIDESIMRISEYVGSGGMVIGMGRKVQSVLTELNIEHMSIIHPAARGKIRKKSRYKTHIQKTLGMR